MEIDLSAEGSHYSLTGGNLVISNPVKEQHVGRYRCLAANTLGTVVSREASVQFGCRWHTCEAPCGPRRCGRAELTELLWSPWSCVLNTLESPRRLGQIPDGVRSYPTATATTARVQCFSNCGHITEHMGATGMKR